MVGRSGNETTRVLLLTCCYRQDQSQLMMVLAEDVLYIGWLCIAISCFMCSMKCMYRLIHTHTHTHAHAHTYTHTPPLCYSLLDPAVNLDGDVLLKKTFVSGEEVTAFISEVTGEGGSMGGCV